MSAVFKYVEFVKTCVWKKNTTVLIIPGTNNVQFFLLQIWNLEEIVCLVSITDFKLYEQAQQQKLFPAKLFD